MSEPIEDTNKEETTEALDQVALEAAADDEEVADEEEQDTTAAVQEVFTVSIADELEEDDIKLAMIGAGATFKNVTRLYNQMMVAAGLAISKEDKAAHVTETLEGLEFETEEDYDKAVALLMDPEKKITERSAGALLRAYAKKNSLEIYKKPQVEGSGRVGFAAGYYDHLVANPRISEANAKAFIMDPKNSENVHRHVSHYMNLWKLASRIVSRFDEAIDAANADNAAKNAPATDAA